MRGWWRLARRCLAAAPAAAKDMAEAAAAAADDPNAEFPNAGCEGVGRSPGEGVGSNPGEGVGNNGDLEYSSGGPPPLL